MYLLDLIGKGLGLEPGYFRDGIELTQSMGMNHYPACPDPSLTLGLPKHADLNLITFVLQEMDGLQVLKDGQWLTVEAVPNAFVVNLGHSLQVNPYVPSSNYVCICFYLREDLWLDLFSAFIMLKLE